MEFDSLTMNQDIRKALNIANVSESELDFEGKHNNNKTLEFFKYDDGDLEITIDDFEANSFIITKEQVECLAKWLSHSR